MYLFFPPFLLELALLSPGPWHNWGGRNRLIIKGASQNCRDVSYAERTRGASAARTATLAMVVAHWCHTCFISMNVEAFWPNQARKGPPEVIFWRRSRRRSKRFPWIHYWPLKGSSGMPPVTLSSKNTEITKPLGFQKSEQVTSWDESAAWRGLRVRRLWWIWDRPTKVWIGLHSTRVRGDILLQCNQCPALHP